MPRTVEEILAHAEELAKRFEDYEAAPGDAKDAAPLRAVREAFEDAARAQSRLNERIAVARVAGLSWASIGAMLGTSGEAARQRYGQPPTAGNVPRNGAAKAAPAKKTPTRAAPATVPAQRTATAKAAPVKAKESGKAVRATLSQAAGQGHIGEGEVETAPIEQRPRCLERRLLDPAHYCYKIRRSTILWRLTDDELGRVSGRCARRPRSRGGAGRGRGLRVRRCGPRCGLRRRSAPAVPGR